MQIKQSRVGIAFGLATLATIGACNAILGLNDISVQDSDASAGNGGSGGGDGAAQCSSTSDCRTNQECTDRATAAAVDAGRSDAGAAVPAVCVKSTCKCVELLTPECTTITGDYTNNDAIVIGSLFQTKGSQAATNLDRQRGATMAVDEIDSSSAGGGIPQGQTSAGARPLVMLSCNTYTDPTAPAGSDPVLFTSARHLVNDLQVPAIVGPNTSQDTLDVSNAITITGGTVVISPTAVADSITGLRDNDLTWLMVPTDVQRAPLMIGDQTTGDGTPVGQIKAIEQQLNPTADPTVKVKLGIVFRDDALGQGTRASLSNLKLNGQSISSQIGGNVHINAYDPAKADQRAAIVSEYVNPTFQPNIVVLAGTAEVVTDIMVPLEAQWTGAGGRPYYILIDSGKVPQLRDAVKNNDDLRKRVRGTGITPGSSQPVFEQFSQSWQIKYPSNPQGASTSGVGPSYDAVYAIAYALAATSNSPVSGANVAKGLRLLAGGAQTFNTGPTQLLPAFQVLTGGDKITVVGTFGKLAWNEHGAVLGGTLEIWCINSTNSFASSGLTFDLESQAPKGAIVPKNCDW